jgi:hypothetical protein
LNALNIHIFKNLHHIREWVRAGAVRVGAETKF